MRKADVGTTWRNQLLRPSIAAALLAMLIASAWATFVHLSTEVLPYDDAFIPLRYVQNLFGGRGLVYNAGEAVMGVSAPLNMIWLIILRAVAGEADLPTLAVRASGLSFLFAGWAIFLLVRRYTGSCGWAPRLESDSC